MKRSREEMEGALLLQLSRQEVHTTPLSAPCTPAWSDLADVLGEEGEEGEEEGSYRSMSPLALPETSFSASKPETKPGALPWTGLPPLQQGRWVCGHRMLVLGVIEKSWGKGRGVAGLL
jgi:hypothetical protein